MRNVTRNFSIAFGLFALVFMIGTCHVNNTPKPENIPIDTSLFHSYKEKVNILQLEYEKQIHALSNSKDSLHQVVRENKKTISQLKFYSNQLRDKITQTLNKPDSCLAKDSLKINTLDYIAIQNQRDSICNINTNALEILASKQDSIIVFQNKEQDNLKDLIKQNELRERHLTEQLNTAYKQQRKINFTNKFCASALILMTGFASALLINQTLK